MLDQLTAALEGRRFNYQDEAELQIGIGEALREAGIHFQRERQLGQDRVDFFLPQRNPDTPHMTGKALPGYRWNRHSCSNPWDPKGIAVEVKVRGATNAVTRQLLRYAHYPEVTELVLITTLARHAQVPRVLSGKTVHVIYLGLETL